MSRAWLAVAALLLSSTAAFEEVIELDTSNWVQTLEGTWLLEFYAPWCGHCKKLAPTYEKVANLFHRESPQRVRVAKVDATLHPGLAAPFDVRGYPMLLLLRDGRHVANFKGARTFAALVAFVEDGLNGRLPAEPGAPAATRAQPPAAGAPRSQLPRRSERYLAEAKSLLTDHHPLHAGLALLGGAAVLGVGMLCCLFACTKPSPR